MFSTKQRIATRLRSLIKQISSSYQTCRLISRSTILIHPWFLLPSFKLMRTTIWL